MKLTPYQETVLRQQPHRTDLYLSIYRPTTIATAIVTGSYSVGSIQINYLAPSGTFLNLFPDMTVLVGSEIGGDDYGRIRMRSATGTYIVMAENSINWTDGLNLTFINYVTPEAIYPRIIKSPTNQTSVIFYKDYDIRYLNQNSIYGTFPCAGPHRATFLTTGNAQIYYTATGTYNVKGDAVSYEWNFEGSLSTGSSSETPGFVNYNTPGHYKTRLRVTSNSGAVDDTYRFVSVYNREGSGDNFPTSKWELTNLSGSRSEGGYTASFRVWENLGDVQPGALVVLFGESWYGGTQLSLGGNADGNSSIIFVGYILEDSITFDYLKSSVEFSVGSITEVMKNTEGFSVSCESKKVARTWFQLQDMTVPKAIYHYLRWHSTILKVTDFQYTADNRLVQYFDADRGSLYDAIDSFMRDGMLGSVISDRQGKLWAEISSFGMETPFINIPNNFTVYKQDWVGDPSIQERRNTELSFIELGGIAYYGTATNGFSALISNAPSTVPLYYGKGDRKEGMILNSQLQLNNIAGNYLAYYNSEFPSVQMDIAGFYNNLDIAPQEIMYLIISGQDTVRGKSLQNLPYIVESMDWKYDSRKEFFSPSVTFQQIATGTAGVTVQIPIVPPDNGYSYPGIELPPLPDFGDSTPIGSSIPSYVLFHDQDKGFIWTDTFDSNNPNYYQMNGGLTVTQYQLANFMFVCPNGAVYVGLVDSATDTEIPPSDCFVARAPALGQPFTVLYDATTLNTGPGRYGVYAAAFNPEVAETVALVLESQDSGRKMFVGNGGGFTAGAVLPGSSFFPGTMSYGKGFWTYSSYDYFARIVANGSSVPFTVNNNGQPQHFRGSSTSERIVSTKNDGSQRWVISLDNGSTWDLIDDTNLRIQGLSNALSPDGLLMMARYNNGGSRGKSSDGGYSWGLLPNLPFGTEYVWNYAGSGGDSIGASRWIAAWSVIRFSPDFGDSWLNREGNYSTIAPLAPDIDMIFTPGISSMCSTNGYN